LSSEKGKKSTKTRKKGSFFFLAGWEEKKSPVPPERGDRALRLPDKKRDFSFYPAGAPRKKGTSHSAGGGKKRGEGIGKKPISLTTGEHQGGKKGAGEITEGGGNKELLLYGREKLYSNLGRTVRGERILPSPKWRGVPLEPPSH